MVAALVGSQIVASRVHDNAQRSQDRQVDLTRVAEQIRYYEELLTTSARLAAATGDPFYVERYDQAAPKLDRAIADAVSLAQDPAVATAFETTGSANQALIALEEKAFRQVAAGDRTGAYATVTSAHYTRFKADYARGLDVALLRIDQSTADQETRAERSEDFGLITSIAGGVLLLGLWAGTARGLRHSERARGVVEERLRSSALYDSVTGLANRVLLADRIRLVGRRRDRGVVALFYADLDDFKVINDEHGHSFGDHVLVEVARRLETCARATDSVARLGGDEFAVLVEGLSHADEVADLARRILAALSSPIELEGIVVHGGASIGSVTIAEHETFPAAEALLHRADLAMYAAKRSRKGSWAGFEQRMYDDVLGHARLSAEIGTAFEQHQFAVWYQPVVDLRRGAMVGAEALVRWIHPERGVVRPNDFLPVVQELGRMPELTRFVLGEACHWAQSRQIEFPDEVPPTVAVNVSPRDLVTSEVVEDVARALVESGLPATSLTIEITETSLFQNIDDIAPTLKAIRATGVSVAVDDFGTGFSSFSHLRELPADVVKIDKSFTDGLTIELEDSTVVAAIVRLAHTLGLSVVAEGVEEVKQLLALRGLDCEFIQGYLIARPAPPADVLSPAEIRRRMAGFGVVGPRPTPPVEQLTVVVADDVESERRLLVRSLERDGRYAVVAEAADGLEAVHLATSLNPHVVLLDMDMPRLDGLAALPLILASAPTTRVVILSGHVTDDLAGRAREAGAVGCLEKGFADVPGLLLEILGATR